MIARSLELLLTLEGRQVLETELADLIRRRPEVVEHLAAARNDGNIAENTALAHARDEQAALEGRIARLQAILREAELIEKPVGNGVVQLGSPVSIDDGLGMVDYWIVGPLETDPGAGRISVRSPVGRALLGARTGQTVVVEAPDGCRSLTLRDVA